MTPLLRLTIPPAVWPINHDICPSPTFELYHSSSFLPSRPKLEDYSDGSWMNNLAPGQITRLKPQVKAFQGIDA